MLRLLLLFVLYPLAATAQIVVQDDAFPTPWMTLNADLTGDGRDDILTATPFSPDFDIITFEVGGTYQPFFIPVPMNRTGDPGIELTSASTFDIRTGCFACGRTHSETLWRMAWRDGALVVAGYRETVVDRLGPKVVMCDANLRTGRSIISVDGLDVGTIKREQGQDRPLTPQDIKASPRPILCATMADYLK